MKDVRPQKFRAQQERRFRDCHSFEGYFGDKQCFVKKNLTLKVFLLSEVLQHPIIRQDIIFYLNSRCCQSKQFIIGIFVALKVISSPS